jgi:predicted transcriptional regulator
MTNQAEPEQLRDKDWTVLHQIQNGHTDIQQITSATLLENHEVNYCFRKLEELSLIEVQKPEGMVERIVNGQRRVFEAPKKAQITEQGQQLLQKDNRTTENDLEDLTHRELVKRVHQLEHEVNQLQRSLEAFKKQVQQTIK